MPVKKSIILLLIPFLLLFTGCNRDKALIFFSAAPMSEETFNLDNIATSFQIEQKIHFVLFNPKPFTDNVLRLQILRFNRVAPSYGVTIEYGRDIEIDKDKSYVADYFCIHRDGYYRLRIFSRNKMEKPIAEADFEVFPL